jgi:hypothetical protein
VKVSLVLVLDGSGPSLGFFVGMLIAIPHARKKVAGKLPDVAQPSGGGNHLFDGLAPRGRRAADQRAQLAAIVFKSTLGGPRSETAVGGE